VWSLVGSNKLPGVADDAVSCLMLETHKLKQFSLSPNHCASYQQPFVRAITRIFLAPETPSQAWFKESSYQTSRSEVSPILSKWAAINNYPLEHDLEQFEDDPLEFIRRDLTVASSVDVATRRHAASDVLQALVSSGYETETTEIVGTWISSGLQEYAKNPAEGWRAKDSAVYLLTAVATRGSTTQVGFT
jgi:exportin-2 (importin alpha re-exporter)